MAAQCGTCRFWDTVRDVDEVPEGRCRRFPPRGQAPKYDDDWDYTSWVREAIFLSWPRTLATDWCGEYQPVTAAETT